MVRTQENTQKHKDKMEGAHALPETVTTIQLYFLPALVPVTRLTRGICGTDISLQVQFSSSFSHLMLHFEHLATF